MKKENADKVLLLVLAAYDLASLAYWEANDRGDEDSPAYDVLVAMEQAFPKIRRLHENCGDDLILTALRSLIDEPEAYVGQLENRGLQ